MSSSPPLTPMAYSLSEKLRKQFPSFFHNCDILPWCFSKSKGCAVTGKSSLIVITLPDSVEHTISIPLKKILKMILWKE